MINITADNGMLEPRRHSFSRYILKQKGIILKQNNKQILQPFYGPELNAWLNRNITPYINIGEKMEVSNIPYRIIKKIDDLESMGYILNSYPINSIPIDKRYARHAQTRIVLIEPKTKRGELTLTKMPTGCHIEYDIINKALRYVDKKKEEDPIYQPWILLQRKIIDTGYVSRWNALDKLREDDIVLEKLYIKEVPIGISEDNKLVCIQLQPDSYRVGFIGKTGMGKTLAMHSYAHFLNLMYDVRNLYINDYVSGTYPWTTPMETPEFLNLLNRIHLDTIPMSGAYLSPIIDSKKIGTKENLNIPFYITWGRFIKYWNTLTEGMGDDLKFGRSRRMIDWKELSECKSKEEVYEYIDGSEIQDNSKFKIKSIFKALFETDLIEFSNKTEITIQSENEKITLPSYLALAYVNITPFIITKTLEGIAMGDRGSALPIVLNYLIKEIYDFKDYNPKIQKLKFCIELDELEAITALGAIKPIIELVSLGRNKGLHFCYTTQNYSGIKPQIQNNTDFMFVFNCNKEQSKKVCRAYQAMDSVTNEIPLLRTHECFVFPKQYSLILYDFSDGTRTETLNPVKIRVMPPPSNHKRPNEEDE